MPDEKFYVVMWALTDLTPSFSLDDASIRSGPVDSGMGVQEDTRLVDPDDGNCHTSMHYLSQTSGNVNCIVGLRKSFRYVIYPELHNTIQHLLMYSSIDS